MQNKKLFIVLILSLVFNLAFLGSLGYRLWEKSKHPEASHRRTSRDSDYYGERLRLSPEQKEHLEQARKEAFQQIRIIHTHLIQDKRELVELLFKEELDSVRIEERLQHIGNLQTDIERRGITRMLKAKEILTPEQSEEFHKMLMEKLNGMHSRYGRRSGTNKNKTEN